MERNCFTSPRERRNFKFPLTKVNQKKILFKGFDEIDK